MTVALQRSTDAEFVNALANHASVRPFIGGDISQPLDLTEAVEHPLNVVLMGEHGGFIMAWSAPGVFEVHTMILPEGRGEWAAEAAGLARDTMFDTFGAEKLWTRVEEGADNVIAYAEKGGMTVWGEATFDLGGGPKTYIILEMTGS